MDALTKLRAEMEQNKNDGYVQYVGQCLIDHLKANPGDAERILTEGKTIKGSLGEMEKEARKKKTGNMAMLTPAEGMAVVLGYFGITGAPVTAPAPVRPSVDFDVSLDDLL